MSNREKCISIIDFFTEEQLEMVALMLESAKKIADEAQDDAFCVQMHENYLQNPDKGEPMLFEDFMKEIGVDIS